MKTFICIALVAFIGVISSAPSEEKYTTKYDGVDIDEILKNDRLLQNYFNCLMEKGNCTPDGEELKSILPDALKTACEKCNEKQREGSKKVINFLIENKRDMWNQLEAKYDKDGVYKKKYKDAAEKEGIKL